MDTTYIRDTTIIRDTVYDLNDSLVAYYNFNKGSLKDSSTWHNDIMQNTATLTVDRFGHPGNAYLFNGSNYMRVPSAFSLSSQTSTIMAIVKFNDFYKGQGYGNNILTKGDFDNEDGVYSLRASPLYAGPTLDTARETFMGFIGDYGLPKIVDSSVYIRTGQWYIVVLTYNGSQMDLYINGKLVASERATGTFFINSYDLYIGRSINYTHPNYFNGVIDEIRIYDKALPPSDIQQFNKLTQ